MIDVSMGDEDRVRFRSEMLHHFFDARRIRPDRRSEYHRARSDAGKIWIDEERVLFSLELISIGSTLGYEPNIASSVWLCIGDDEPGIMFKPGANSLRKKKKQEENSLHRENAPRSHVCYLCANMRASSSSSRSTTRRSRGTSDP